MDRRAFLTKVMEEAHLDNLRQADFATRVVVGVLKSLVPSDLAEEIASLLPEDLREGWLQVEPYPADILEREDFYFEGEGTESTQMEITITQG